MFKLVVELMKIDFCDKPAGWLFNFKVIEYNKKYYERTPI